jgi:ribosomal protein L11 methyltransferase
VLQLVVTVASGEAELASHMLWDLGVLAIEERESGVGTHDHLVELWTALGDDSSAVAHAAEAFPKRWRWRLVEVDPAVADTWRQYARPTWVSDDLVIVPAWVPFDAPAGTTVVRIETGATFGLGDHPTTMLTIRMMRQALWKGATVLDVGCGSGVLGITACLLGAARVTAIDISPAALSVATSNAVANGVAERIEVSNTPLAEVEGNFDIVVANILAPALIELSDDLRRVVGPSGVLVISGLLDGRSAHVVDALAPLRVVAQQDKDGWVAISLCH